MINKLISSKDISTGPTVDLDGDTIVKDDPSDDTPAVGQLVCSATDDEALVQANFAIEQVR